MVKNKIILCKRPALFLVIMLLSCNSQTIREKANKIYNEIDKDLLIKRSLEGDSIAYNDLESYMYIKNESHQLFYVASIVANKYNNPDAYFDLFWAYIYSDLKVLNRKEQLDLLDRRSRAYCLYNLLKSIELGKVEAKEIAIELFPDSNSIPSSYLDSLKSIK